MQIMGLKPAYIGKFWQQN